VPKTRIPPGYSPMPTSTFELGGAPGGGPMDDYSGMAGYGSPFPGYANYAAQSAYGSNEQLNQTMEQLRTMLGGRRLAELAPAVRQALGPEFERYFEDE
jgi:hypothetical protein